MILLIVPAAVLAVMSLAAFGGCWIWWLDVLANFRAQYVLALLVLGVVIATSRWRRTGLTIIGVALLNLAFVAPFFVGSPGNPVEGAPTIRLITFNLLSSNKNYGGVIDYIDANDPDVVLLHEASRPWEVAMESSDLGYKVIRARSNNLIFGTLVMVRGDVTAISHGFAAAQPRAVELIWTPDGWSEPFSLLSIHPLAPTSAERAGLRDAQLEFATTWASSQDGAYAVAGDLNATPWSWPYRRLVSQGELRDSSIGYGLHATFPADSMPLLRVPIDHVLISDHLRSSRYAIGPNLESDHNPVLVDLEYVIPPTD